MPGSPETTSTLSYRAGIDPDALRIAPDDHALTLVARNEKTV
jgi:hypothetical protein